MKPYLIVFILCLICFNPGCIPNTANTNHHQVNYFTATDTSPSDAGDSFDWQNQSPIDFIALLKTRNPQDAYIVTGIHKNWIQKSDIPNLLELLDSSEPCAPVAMVISSYAELNGSTVGEEAAFMITGFQEGEYPPSLNSTRPRITGKDKEALREWWEVSKKD